VESVNAALAMSFDVDPQRIARTPTDLEIDQLDGLTGLTGVATFCACFSDGSVSPCVPPPVRSEG
jgi:hypothetical protein